VGHSDPGILFFFLLRCFNFSVCIFCLVVEVIEEKEKKKRSFVSVSLVEKWVLVFACS
jgi:hypothetical protein